MEVKITELTIDLLENATLFLETVSNVRDTGVISLQAQKEILHKINSQDGHIFVAITSDNKIVGTTTVLIEQKYIRNGARVAHIEDVATHADYQKQGIGKQIMQRCIEYAKSKNCYKIILDCYEQLKPFYEQFGFKNNEIHMRLDL
ncbi:GNAT family N-acetyltransferase [Candidatus Woesearchaeota archaeon]|nr:GNAT family N-acetyltransferase [Candidatus Woesearchaeota archaeon]